MILQNYCHIALLMQNLWVRIDLIGSERNMLCQKFLLMSNLQENKIIKILGKCKYWRNMGVKFEVNSIDKWREHVHSLKVTRDCTKVFAIFTVAFRECKHIEDALNV